jgi:hypothetical protein
VHPTLENNHNIPHLEVQAVAAVAAAAAATVMVMVNFRTVQIPLLLDGIYDGMYWSDAGDVVYGR